MRRMLNMFVSWLLIIGHLGATLSLQGSCLPAWPPISPHFPQFGPQTAKNEVVGLYYLRARLMNPLTGRFWSADSFEGSQRDPQSLHKYLYGNCDPVNGIDPSGMFTLTEMATVTALASITTFAVSSILHDIGYEKGSLRSEGLSRMLAGVSLVIGARLAAVENPRFAYALAAAASDEIVAGGEQFITGSRVPSPLEALGQSLGFSAESAHAYVLSFKVVTSVGPLFYATALRLQQVARTLLSDVEMAAAESEQSVADLLANRGRAIGSEGENPGVRTVESMDELQRLFSKLSVAGENFTPGDYNGLMVKLPDGTTVGFRFSSLTGGSTVDVTPASGKPFRVHIQ